MFIMEPLNLFKRDFSIICFTFKMCLLEKSIELFTFGFEKKNRINYARVIEFRAFCCPLKLFANRKIYVLEPNSTPQSDS